MIWGAAVCNASVNAENHDLWEWMICQKERDRFHTEEVYGLIWEVDNINQERLLCSCFQLNSGRGVNVEKYLLYPRSTKFLVALRLCIIVCNMCSRCRTSWEDLLFDVTYSCTEMHMKQWQLGVLCGASTNNVDNQDCLCQELRTERSLRNVWHSSQMPDSPVSLKVQGL